MAEHERRRGERRRKFFDTPEYWAWVKSVDEKINGRNSVTRQRNDRNYPGYVVLPPVASKDFEGGFLSHAELYNTQVKGNPNG